MQHLANLVDHLQSHRSTSEVYLPHPKPGDNREFQIWTAPSELRQSPGGLKHLMMLTMPSGAIEHAYPSVDGDVMRFGWARYTLGAAGQNPVKVTFFPHDSILRDIAATCTKSEDSITDAEKILSSTLETYRVMDNLQRTIDSLKPRFHHSSRFQAQPEGVGLYHYDRTGDLTAYTSYLEYSTELDRLQRQFKPAIITLPAHFRDARARDLIAQHHLTIEHLVPLSLSVQITGKHLLDPESLMEDLPGLLSDKNPVPLDLKDPRAPLNAHQIYIERITCMMIINYELSRRASILLPAGQIPVLGPPIPLGGTRAIRPVGGVTTFQHIERQFPIPAYDSDAFQFTATIDKLRADHLRQLNELS